MIYYLNRYLSVNTMSYIYVKYINKWELFSFKYYFRYYLMNIYFCYFNNLYCKI